MDNVYYEWHAETKEETENSVAKVVTVPGTQEVRYFIKVHNGQFLDPSSGDFFRLKGTRSKWKKVSPDSFNQYLRFLETGVKRYLHYAGRGIQS